jgi:hypothetical protein
MRVKEPIGEFPSGIHALVRMTTHPTTLESVSQVCLTIKNKRELCGLESLVNS